MNYFNVILLLFIGLFIYANIENDSKKFDLIIVDNSTLSEGDHYEHFDLFPHLFKKLKDDAILILNIMPKLMKCSKERLFERKKFYNCENPINITFNEIEKTYKELALTNKFKIDNYFYTKRKRWDFLKKRDIVYYGVFFFKKRL